MENLKEAGQKVLDSNTDLLTCEFDACESQQKRRDIK